MGKTVILDGARTPFGKFGGSLSSFTASELGGFAVKEALKRAGVSGEEVEEVILGSVLQGGQGQIPSRQASRHAGLPWNVKTETINKVCASGMRSVTMGDQIIRAGDGEVIVAGNGIHVQCTVHPSESSLGLQDGGFPSEGLNGS